MVVLFWDGPGGARGGNQGGAGTTGAQYQGKFALALSDIAKDQTLAQQLRVQGIPSIRVVKDGQLAEQMEGPQGEGVLRQLIDRLTQSPADALKSQLGHFLEIEDYDGLSPFSRRRSPPSPTTRGSRWSGPTCCC